MPGPGLRNAPEDTADTATAAIDSTVGMGWRCDIDDGGGGTYGEDLSQWCLQQVVDEGYGTETVSSRIMHKCWLRGQVGVSRAGVRFRVESVAG